MLIMLWPLKREFWPGSVWVVAFLLQALALGATYATEKLAYEDAKQMESIQNTALPVDDVAEHVAWGTRLFWCYAGGLVLSFLALMLSYVHGLRVVAFIGALVAIVPAFMSAYTGAKLIFHNPSMRIYHEEPAKEKVDSVEYLGPAPVQPSTSVNNTPVQ
tara:strand:+ start:3987 stop:4466 length:480 start_codon:yes stop_codon:yes gene_type:complete